MVASLRHSLSPEQWTPPGFHRGRDSVHCSALLSLLQLPCHCHDRSVFNGLLRRQATLLSRDAERIVEPLEGVFAGNALFQGNSLFLSFDIIVASLRPVIDLRRLQPLTGQAHA